MSHWNGSFHVFPLDDFMLQDFSRLVGNTSQLLRHSKFVLVSRHQKDSSVTVHYIKTFSLALLGKKGALYSQHYLKSWSKPEIVLFGWVF